MSFELPEKITFRWAFHRVSFDRDIARKYAPAEYRAVVDASAVAPWVDLAQVDSMMKAQWERDHPNA
jgi:hypothetical protein